MTRFWITLDQGVHFVLKVLELGKGGEIFVPKIPAMLVTDLARAIAPECKHEVVGIRPGGKIHESLIGVEEGRNTVEYKECYVIKQSIHSYEEIIELGGKGKPCPDGFSYTSDLDVDTITVEKLQEMLNSIEGDYAIEKSRWSMDDIPR